MTASLSENIQIYTIHGQSCPFSLLNDNVRKMNTFMNKVALNTFSSFDSGNKPSEETEPERGKDKKVRLCLSGEDVPDRKEDGTYRLSV